MFRSVFCRVEVSRMKNKKSMPEALAEVSVAMPNASPIAKGKALAESLGAPVVTIAMAVPEIKVREVIEFGKHAKLVNKPVAEQKPWEHRAYLREWFTENPDVNTVTHATSHTINEIYTHAIAKMQELYAARSPVNPMFKARDLANAFATMGPAWQDIIRNAMKKLAKDGKVAIHSETHGKTIRYTFELLDLPQVQASQ